MAVLFNAMGCLDFVMTQSGNSAYLEANGFTHTQIDFLFSYPWWAVVIWGTAVWATMLGAVCLLAGKQWASTAYSIGLTAYIIAMIRQYGFSDFTQHFPEGEYQVMSVIIFVLIIGQLLYAQAMRRTRVLR